jgi:hypothetical protein
MSLPTQHNAATTGDTSIQLQLHNSNSNPTSKKSQLLLLLLLPDNINDVGAASSS